MRVTKTHYQKNSRNVATSPDNVDNVDNNIVVITPNDLFEHINTFVASPLWSYHGDVPAEMEDQCNRELLDLCNGFRLIGLNVVLTHIRGSSRSSRSSRSFGSSRSSQASAAIVLRIKLGDGQHSMQAGIQTFFNNQLSVMCLHKESTNLVRDYYTDFFTDIL